MVRQITSSLFAFAAALPLLAVGAPPAMAQGGHYRAELATAPRSSTLVVRELAWKCGPSACVSGASNSRPAIDCAALAREAGALRSFSVAGKPLSAEELGKCNARAR